MNAKQRAEELLETWINGNRKDVLQALGQMSQMRAAYISAYIALELEDDDRPMFNADDFLRMMRNRLD